MNGVRETVSSEGTISWRCNDCDWDLCKECIGKYAKTEEKVDQLGREIKHLTHACKMIYVP